MRNVERRGFLGRALSGLALAAVGPTKKSHASSGIQSPGEANNVATQENGGARRSDPRKVFLHEEAWRKTFRGFLITDVAARNRNIVCLVLRKSTTKEEAGELFDHDIPTRYATLFLDVEELGERWGHQGLEGFRRPVCGVSRDPVGQGMAISANGDTFASGSRKKGMEQISPKEPPTSIERARCVADQTYAVGLLREVYRRVGIGQWEPLLAGLPKPTEQEMKPDRLFDSGFRDIDGFGPNDLYAVGGKGDVWHHDGKAWSKLAFPDRLPLFTVCCAGDDAVYISGEGGTVYRGRGSSWTRIWKAESTIPYNDVRWFENRLWLCSDYALDVLNDGKIEHATHKGERLPLRGHMDSATGILVIASQEEVHAFDGQHWRVLVRPFD